MYFRLLRNSADFKDKPHNDVTWLTCVSGVCAIPKSLEKKQMQGLEVPFFDL